MSTPEKDPYSQQELLRSIAASLKGIQSSLEHLTGAVEGVAESIETAHEPEGDLGVHLVGALKELTSALHKRAQQERAPQPQQRQNIPQHPQQNRRDDRPLQRSDQRSERLELRPRQDLHPQDAPQSPAPPESTETHQSKIPVDFQSSDAHVESPAASSPTPQESHPSKPRPNRNRRGSRGNKASGQQSPQSTTPSAASGE